MIKYRHYTRQANLYPKIEAVTNVCSGGFYGFGTFIPHGFNIGDVIRFSGYTIDTTINGFHTITAVGSPTLFTTDIPCFGMTGDSGHAQLFNLSTFEQLFPLGFKEITWEQEQDEIFTRRKMNDELTFINQPTDNNFNFDYFLSIENGLAYYLGRCEEQQYYIERSCNLGLTYEAFWDGYFSINDGKFDLDKCIYSTKIKVDDEYRCLLENGDKEINILQTTPSVTVTADYSLTFEFINCGCVNVGPTAQATFNGCIFPALQPDGIFPIGDPIFVNANCISGGQGWRNYTTTYFHLGGGVFQICSIWIRQTNTTLDVGGNPNPPSGSGWINIGATTIAGQPAHNWARDPYNGLYTTYLWTLSGGCVFTAQLQIPLTSTTTYTTGRLMEDVVNFTSSESCEDFDSMASDFFEINPPGDTPGYVPGDNYVTGTTNRINLLAFIQKSDFLNPTSSEKASKGILTFNSLMNIFKQVFQAYWFIENGQIRIEHISWFTQILAFDLTSAQYLKFIRGTKEYSYLKEKMPREENFKWIEAGNPDFLGLPITYDSSCVDQDLISNVTINNVVTDIAYISDHTTDSPKEGFVLIATEFSGGVYKTLIENGLITGLPLPNAHLSLANLLYNYFRHNRVLLQGTMNNIFQTFFTAIKVKKQVEVSFPFCCEDEIIPEQSKIITELGTGYLQDGAKLDVKNNMLSVTLVYD